MSEALNEDRATGTGPGWGHARALLLSNPDLMLDDAQLLQALGLRHAAINIIEFGPAALARLKADKAKEASARQEIEQLARANHTAQVEVHALVLDLLEAQGLSDLAERVNAGVQRRFGLEAAVVAVEGQAPVGWRALPPGLLDYVVGRDRPCAVGPSTGGAEIFGEAAERVRSVALVRLRLFDPVRSGVLAFGSADAQAFTADMGVELIAFLARVIERATARWPLRV